MSFSSDMKKIILIEEESVARKNAAFQKVFNALSSMELTNINKNDNSNEGNSLEEIETLSSNYKNVKAIYHQSVNETLTFSEQLKNIELEKNEALHYENQKKALKMRRKIGADEEEDGYDGGALAAHHMSTTQIAHTETVHGNKVPMTATKAKINTKLHMSADGIQNDDHKHDTVSTIFQQSQFDAALLEIEEYYGLSARGTNDQSCVDDDTQMIDDDPVAAAEVMDPDLADVFKYLDHHQTSSSSSQSSSATAVSRDNRGKPVPSTSKSMTATSNKTDYSNLLKLRDRSDLILMHSDNHNVGDDVSLPLSAGTSSTPIVPPTLSIQNHIHAPQQQQLNTNSHQLSDTNIDSDEIRKQIYNSQSK